MRTLAATGEKGVLMFSRRYARSAREHMDRCTKPEIKTQVMVIIFIIVIIVTHFNRMNSTNSENAVILCMDVKNTSLRNLHL